MKIKRLDRYIFSQVFMACFACVFIFMIVWIMPEILPKTVQRVLNGTYSIETGLSIILFEMPKVLNIALPVGMLLGTILTFDKLSKNSEITVMRSSGFSFLRIISSVIILSFLVMGLAYVVGSDLLPYTANKLKTIKGESRSSQFVFPVKKADGAMDKILVVSNFDDNNIRDVIVLNFYNDYEKGSSLLSSIIMSDYVKVTTETKTIKTSIGEEKTITGIKSWDINRGKEYMISEDGIFHEINEVKDLTVLEGNRAKNAQKLMKYSIYRDRELTNFQIAEYTYLLHSEQMDDEFRSMLNKLIKRFVHPFMCVVFAILGCLLGFSKPREQKFLGLLIAVCVIFVYYITLPFFDLLAEKGVLSPLLTSVLPAIACMILIVFIKKHKDL